MDEYKADQTFEVQLVTQNATLDDLSLGDYRDMFEEVRGRTAAGALIKSYGDPSWDAKTIENYRQYFFRYEKGELKVPNRGMRNILRRANGKPPLPLTIADAVSADTQPDSPVWKVGTGITERLIMLAGTEPVTLHVDDDVTVISGYNPLSSVDVTGGQGDVQTALESTVARKRYIRPTRTDLRVTIDRSEFLLTLIPPDVLQAHADQLAQWDERMAGIRLRYGYVTKESENGDNTDDSAS